MAEGPKKVLEIKLGRLGPPDGTHEVKACYCGSCLREYGESMEFSILGGSELDSSGNNNICRDHPDNCEWIFADDTCEFTAEEVTHLIQEGARIKLQRCFPQIAPEDERFDLSRSNAPQSKDVTDDYFVLVVPFQAVEA